jgi:virulence-associated protein VagC
MVPVKSHARVFMNGRSQHVTIPRAFRFRSDMVSICRDPASGDVILSEIPALETIFAALSAEPFPEGFLSEADRDTRPAEERPELGIA